MFAIFSQKKLIACAVILVELIALISPLGSSWAIALQSGTTIEVRVSASADDAEESGSGGTLLTSNDLDLVFVSGNQTVGMRFNALNIPRGAKITNAYIQFRADGVNSDSATLMIEGEDIDNSSAFVALTGNISSRPRTNTSILWYPSPWTTVGEIGVNQRTPNIAPIIQEITLRSGWSSGNSLAILVNGSGTRIASAYDGSPAAAPLLHVEYTLGGNIVPLVDIDSPARGSTFNQGNSATFIATADDFEDGNVASSLSWSSNIDGVIGTGGSFSTTGLSVGVHTITATATDSLGQTGFDTTKITVFANNVPVLVGVGDIADDGWRDEETARLLETIPGTVFTLGDNVYPDGTDADFANYYDPTWGRHRARTRPSAGNHDYHISGGPGYYNYFGASAGDPSKGYYSYNVGEWHIVVLNTECSKVAGGCGANSPQGLWLQADLAANPRACTLAYFHRPLFTSSSLFKSTDVLDFWTILYNAEADLILNGHAHNYERFAPQNPSGVAEPTRGIREFVAGMGGTSFGSFDIIAPNSEARNSGAAGVLKLTLNPTSYNWEFVPIVGETFTDSGSANCVGTLSFPTATPSPTITPGPSPTPTQTFTPTLPPTTNPLYASFFTDGSVGGVNFSDEDIMKFDGQTWSMLFDGSDVGVSGDLFGFSIVDADTFLMAFDTPLLLNGINVTPQDIMRFDATSLGSVTAGTFSMYLNGIDVGLDTANESIDSVTVLPDGRVLISTTSSSTVPGISGADEDVLAFTPTSLGNDTSGSWAMYFDGSDVGLSELSSEDVDALDVDPNGNIYLSTTGDFAVAGLSGFDEDVFICAPTSLGSTTACNYSPTLYFDGSTWGQDVNDVDAFSLLISGSFPTATPTSTPLPTNTPTLTRTPTLGPSPTPTAVASNAPLYASFGSNGSVGGVSFSDEDIVKFDGSTWSLLFDGSDVGVGGSDLFGFSMLDSDSILMSFTSALTLNGIAVAPQDVVRFDATSLGSVTAGTFSMYLNGVDVGLDAASESIDAVNLLADGRVLISTTGNISVPNASGLDEDVLAFTPSGLGVNTSGTWAMYFDGSDVGLADSSNEDVDALDITSNGNIYLSTTGNFAVAGVSGFDEDVFICAPITTGDTTSCAYSSTLYFDGGTWALDANDLDAFHYLTVGPVPTSTPAPTLTNTPIPTNTSIPTNTLTATSTFTPTNTAQPTFTFTATNTLTPTSTYTPGPSPTYTFTQTPTATFTATNTPAPSLTPTHTFTPTATFMPTDTPFVTATSTVTPAGDLIFADGFESGNLSAWSSAVTGAGDLNVSNSAALTGANGMQVVVNDMTAMYVNDDTPNAEPRYRVRFYFDPNSIAMTDADYHPLLSAYDATIVFHVDFRISSGSYQIRLRQYNDAAVLQSTGWSTISDAPHFIEVDWRAATTIGSNDGSITLWIDGVQKSALTGLDNDTRRIDRAALGAVSSVDAGTLGIYYLDAFESRRQTYIGP